MKLGRIEKEAILTACIGIPILNLYLFTIYSLNPLMDVIVVFVIVIVGWGISRIILDLIKKPCKDR